jgi:hypothetical protein
MITPRWGFKIVRVHTHRALPCAIDLRAFSPWKCCVNLLAFSPCKRCVNLFYRCHIFSVFALASGGLKVQR